MEEPKVRKSHLSLPNLLLPEKVFRNIILVLLVGMAVALLQPLRKLLYPVTNLEELKQSRDTVISYDQAIHQLLPEKIKARAAEADCRGTIALDDSIRGSEYPRTLGNDIRLGFLKYDQWELMIDKGTYAEITRRFDTLLREWPGSFSSSDLERIADMGKKRVMPDYEVHVAWDSVPTANVNNVKMTVTIFKPLYNEQIISEIVKLTHPKTKIFLERKIAEETRHLARLDQQARVGRYVFYALLGIALLLSLVQGYSARRRYWLITQHKQYLLDIIPKRIEYLKSGNFIAALELAEEYLAYYPADIDILAFRQAVLDYTNNNPHQMQLDLVEYKKLQARIESSVARKRNLLESSHTELGTENQPGDRKDWRSFLTQASTDVEELRSGKEINEKIERINSFLNQGRIIAAEEALAGLDPSASSKARLSELREMLDTRRQEARQGLEEIQSLLQSGDLKEARRRLTFHLGNFPDHDPALQLQATLNRASTAGTDAFKLTPVTGDRDWFIFCRDTLTIGREDAGVQVDIALTDRRISREHARLMVKPAQVVIHDLNSTNGTFIDGAPVQRETLKTGTTLTLSKVVNLEVTIQTREGRITGLLLSAAGADYMIPVSQLSIGPGDAGFSLGGDYCLHRNSGILLLTGPRTCVIFEDGIEVRLEGHDFKLEVLP